MLATAHVMKCLRHLILVICLMLRRCTDIECPPCLPPLFRTCRARRAVCWLGPGTQAVIQGTSGRAARAAVLGSRRRGPSQPPQGGSSRQSHGSCRGRAGRWTLTPEQRLWGERGCTTERAREPFWRVMGCSASHSASSYTLCYSPPHTPPSPPPPGPSTSSSFSSCSSRCFHIGTGGVGVLSRSRLWWW